MTKMLARSSRPRRRLRCLRKGHSYVVYLDDTAHERCRRCGRRRPLRVRRARLV